MSSAKKMINTHGLMTYGQTYNFQVYKICMMCAIYVQKYDFEPISIHRVYFQLTMTLFLYSDVTLSSVSDHKNSIKRLLSEKYIFWHRYSNVHGFVYATDKIGINEFFWVVYKKIQKAWMGSTEQFTFTIIW